MVRNSGKFGKPKRGGAKRFTPARTLRAEAEEKEGMWEGGEKSSGDEDEEEEEDEDSEESSSDDEPPSTTTTSAPRASTSAAASSGAPAPAVGSDGKDRFGNLPEVSAREAKKAAKQQRAQKAKAESGSDDEEDDDLLNAGRANANLTKQMKASSLGSSEPASKPSKGPPAGMNRKEREEAAKKAAREKYLELHRAGKTTEAKSDLARLAVIRKEREEAAARKAAEKAEQDAAKETALGASGRRR